MSYVSLGRGGSDTTATDLWYGDNPYEDCSADYDCPTGKVCNQVTKTCTWDDPCIDSILRGTAVGAEVRAALAKTKLVTAENVEQSDIAELQFVLNKLSASTPKANACLGSEMARLKRLLAEKKCPAGTTGTYPDCVKVPTSPKTCPAGTTGTYPNCVAAQQEPSEEVLPEDYSWLAWLMVAGVGLAGTVMFVASRKKKAH